MSVSLCAFRLEIASGLNPIGFEEYIAPKLSKMSSGSCAGDAESGQGRRPMRWQHDRRVMGPVTVETVVPRLVEGAAAGAGPAGSAGQAPAGAAAGALSQQGASPPPSAASTRAAAAGASGSSLGSGSRGATPPAATAGPSGTSPGSAASRGATPPVAAGGGSAGASPDTLSAEGGARRWDRDRAPPDGDMVMGPSGRAVSYAELVKSGREPSLPPRPSKEGTPADEPALEQKPFISGNPFVEVTKGLLHLYKENAMTSLEEGTERSEMICMMSVPAKMAIHDLLQFTAACYPDIERMRIIRDSTPNQYMVLLKFKTQAAADEFYRNFNGVAYNSLEPETCHLVYVSRVDLVNESDEARLPIPGFTELPTCPVCLERMDESVDGILTVLCNHTFHGSCLSQWGDTSCPVCRYVQTPEQAEDNFCFECQASDSLWICLICGHVGCGRYVGGHAYSHFLDTGHTYTMRVGSTRVWDYVGDNFVHRLVQNKEDGKMVEVEDGREPGQRDSKHADSEEKLEGIQLEYTYLLTSQLQSQRQYYEECIARIEKDGQKQADELRERTRQSVEETHTLRERVQQAGRDRAAAEKKVQQLTQRLNRCQKELDEEKQINKSLRENQAGWQDRVKRLEANLGEIKREKDKEVQDLKEQVRDLMFFLEAQQKIAAESSSLQQELAEGSIVVPDAPPTKPSGAGARRKKR
ncbi:BRCA1-associated protein-like [Amphibalanus amphitrite]|uniref:BRCA1-associated protein-like n=1 Tax=Amphibalanus amphitrite TaxID=1232801 RepID=UPI001C8FD92E|nr:BRCA1-associated protein-like [Amphibalanus amphitrite]